jgi:uncharacterized phage protein gp47/JayE
MPFSRPSLTELRATAVQDIVSSGVPGLDGLLRNAVLRVLAMVMAGLAYSVYGFIDWIARESVPFTATDEYLEAWAGLIAVYRKDSSPASGNGAQFSGTAGTLVPLGATLTRQDGTPYTSTAAATVDGTGVVLVPILAAVNGAGTNCDAGTYISLDPPIAGINSGGVITVPLTGGADQEADDEFRSRMLLKYAAPPQGGSESDYIEWATQQVPGCTRAWITPNGYGVGSVAVFVMFDDAQAAHGGFPQGTDGCAAEEVNGPTATGDQLAVAEAIWPLQPVPVLVYVAAPAAFSVNVTLAALVPNDAGTIADITASLNDMFLALGEVGGTIYPSQLYQAISLTPGVDHFTMTAPAAAVTAGAGQLPVLGTLTVS